MSFQKLDDHQGKLEVVREKIASFESSLQSAKDTISDLEKDLHTSNARLKWFKYKLGETKCKLGAADLKASNLKEVVSDLNAEAELYKKEMGLIKDEAMDRRIDADFMIF